MSFPIAHYVSLVQALLSDFITQVGRSSSPSDEVRILTDEGKMRVLCVHTKPDVVCFDD